jgi:hypothetical protein
MSNFDQLRALGLRQAYHDWQQTCQCGEAVQCVDCKAAWVVRSNQPEPPHLAANTLDVQRLARALFTTRPMFYPAAWPNDDPDDIGPSPEDDAKAIAAAYSEDVDPESIENRRERARREENGL